MRKTLFSLLALICTFTITFNAQAKMMDILDVLMGGGGFEAGDTIQGPVAMDTSTPTQAPIQALKYNNGVRTDVMTASPTQKSLETQNTAIGKISSPLQAVFNMDDDTTPKVGVVTADTNTQAPIQALKYNNGIKKQVNPQEDEPFNDFFQAVQTGTHAATFSFPSFSFGTSTTSVAYTTDTDSLRSQLNTPEVTLSYMSTNFSYANHDGNTPYAPSELNSRRSGDCKDFATFFGWALADDGWEVHTIDYQYGSSSGHVISLYPGSDGQWYAQSNQYSVGPISSTEDAIAQTMPSGGTLGSYREFPAGYTGTYSWK